MQINDFEKMQQNLYKMKSNLEDIKHIEMNSNAKRKASKKGRRALKKKINRIEHPNITRIARDEQTIVIVTIIIVAFTCIFSTSIFAKTISENNVENQTVKDVEDEEIILESNQNVIPLEEILLENVSVLKSKEYAEEERPIDFEIIYNENPDLPEGEAVITQSGINGKQHVTVIKSYENNVLVSENILEAAQISEPTVQIVDKGTSKFLANNKVHLGDTMYVVEEVALNSEPNEDAEEICPIYKSLDVTLEELAGKEWCKVNYEGIEGFVKCKNLTSSLVTPGIVEANRVQKIKLTLSEDMALNYSTDLTLEDYKKILSGNSADKNKIIEENAEVFYNMDKTYNLNGVFLASMAIHESGWGTSVISKDKKNLFGYGAYDRGPYENSFSFDTYAEGIELVAKVLVKYYLNEEGTPIYDEEIAKGAYYNGPTAADVNVRYASDVEWHNKIYKYMEYLYNRL